MADLFIFAGLPGTGKTTLARRFAQRLRAAHVRVDTIEQGLRDLCHMRVEGEGYRLAYRIAADNLQPGVDVVADSCNPLELTRREWEQVALTAGCRFFNIEVICSDIGEHQRRIASRASDIAGLTLPTWLEVRDRMYEPWSKERIVVDTAGRTEQQCLDSLMAAINAFREQL